jgi:transcriptional regulator with XRE-family HTH domain
MDAASILTYCRTRAGLAQRALAARADTSAAAICLYERGERIPRIDTLVRLIAATGWTIELVASAPAEIDASASARTLRELLDLSDRLPQSPSSELEAPVFAALAGRASTARSPRPDNPDSITATR